MRYFLAFALTLVAGVLTSTEIVAADVLSGVWSGGGTVKLAEGGVEKVRCRVSYSKSTGKTFMLNATCSHSNGMFQQSGRVVQISGSRFTGRLYSEQYSVSGNVAISVRGGSQTVSVTSPKGSGSIRLSRQ